MKKRLKDVNKVDLAIGAFLVFVVLYMVWQILRQPTI